MDEQLRYVKQLMPFGSKQYFEKARREKEQAIQQMKDEQVQFENIQKEKLERLQEADRKQKLPWTAWFLEGMIEFFRNAWVEIKSDALHGKRKNKKQESKTIKR